MNQITIWTFWGCRAIHSHLEMAIVQIKKSSCIIGESSSIRENVKMEKMIAFCGLECHQCGAFIAALENDDQKRREVAELWSKEHNADIQPKDIHCVGCTSDEGILFQYCQQCEIRICGKTRAIENCAHCDEYACDKLEAFFTMVPEAKLRLDTLRSKF